MTTFSRERTTLFAMVIGGLLCSINTTRAQENQKVEGWLDSLYDAHLVQVADTNSYRFFAGSQAGNELLGATFVPISDAWRSQLNIPKGQGVLVASVKNEGSSAVAGLLENDILLSLGEHVLASDEDLIKYLKAADKTALPLRLLRNGKKITIQVRPITRVTIGPAADQKTEYYIGVSVDPVDEALRAQLALPAGQGIIVNTVVEGSPAEKAGIHTHDIILTLNDKPIEKQELLKQHVQSAADSPLRVKLLRAGKQMSIDVTPGLRKVENTPNFNQSYNNFLKTRYNSSLVGTSGSLVTVGEPTLSGTLANSITQWNPAPPVSVLQARLDQLEADQKELRSLLEKLKQADKTKK